MNTLIKTVLLGVITAGAGSAAADRITLYSDSQFRGRQFSADQPVSNFARTPFQDRISSAVVHEGRWEICIDSDFRGGCSVLNPGAYPNLGAYADRISSIRPLDGRYGEGRSEPRHERDYAGRNGDARAVLYEGPNMSGRAFPLHDAVTSLGRTGFNDRASSLRVESGYWIFCSDSEFRGECRTFGPGEYAQLPGLNNVISSGRRIANYYPYGDRPDWRDSYRPSQGSLNQGSALNRR